MEDLLHEHDDKDSAVESVWLLRHTGSEAEEGRPGPALHPPLLLQVLPDYSEVLLPVPGHAVQQHHGRLVPQQRYHQDPVVWRYQADWEEHNPFVIDVDATGVVSDPGVATLHHGQAGCLFLPLCLAVPPYVNPRELLVEIGGEDVGAGGHLSFGSDKYLAAGKVNQCVVQPGRVTQQDIVQ